MYKLVLALILLFNPFLRAEDKLTYFETHFNIQTSKSEIPGLLSLKSYVPTFRLSTLAQVFSANKYYLFTYTNIVKNHDFSQLSDQLSTQASKYEHGEGFDYFDVGLVLRKVLQQKNTALGFGLGADVLKSDASFYHICGTCQANLLFKRLLLSLKANSNFSSKKNIAKDKIKTPFAHPFLYKDSEDFDEKEYICPLLHLKVGYLISSKYTIGAELSGYIDAKEGDFKSLANQIVASSSFSFLPGITIRLTGKYDINLNREFYKNITIGISLKYALFSVDKQEPISLFKQLNHCILT